MKTLEARGARIEIPDQCETCGSVCTDEQALDHLREWDELLHRCVFCGEPIRITAMKLDHVHKSEVDEEGWGVTYAPMEHEPHWDWGTHMPFGWIDIHAHVDCAKKKMPYANFEETVYGRPRVVPEGCMPRIIAHPCKDCKEAPTEETGRSVAAWVYSFCGPCVYCGNPIRIPLLELQHRSLTGKHDGYWYYKNYKREAILNWQGYKAEGKGTESLDFTGHFHCAMKAMPYVRWGEFEFVCERLKDSCPELANEKVRRFVRMSIGKEARELRMLSRDQIEHLIYATVMELEGPREWFPGLKK